MEMDLTTMVIFAILIVVRLKRNLKKKIKEYEKKSKIEVIVVLVGEVAHHTGLTIVMVLV